MNINKLPTLDQINLNQKRVFIREDLNVPLKDGVITDDTRIKAALPTIKKALSENAGVVLLSHLGRPIEGEFDGRYSLAPVAVRLSELLGQPVKLIGNVTESINVTPGDIFLAENVRFNKGETANDDVLAKKMASQCDVFVMDAFATAHRAHASTCGIAEFAKEKCAGPLLIQELTALSATFENPKKPLVAIVGGSKVSTKFELLANLLEKVDGLIVGGGIANTFLKATDVEVGASLYEPVWVDKAVELYRDAIERGVSFPLPEDVVVAGEMSSKATAKTISVSDIEATDAIFDIGPKTASHYREQLKNAKTIVWNGPVGVFEIEQFSHGTKALGDAIAASDAYSLAGGGDTLAALAKFNLSEKISYISTGGGAFLEFLEGKELPAVKILSEPRA